MFFKLKKFADCYAVETEKDKIKNTAFANFINKYKKIECAAQSSLCDVYEILRSLKCLLKENKLLLLKMDTLKEANYVSQLNQIKDKIENLIHKLDKNKTAVDWPATAQVLLLCAWRSIKEASLYLGDFISKLPVEVGSMVLILILATSVNFRREALT